jgi:hypothetical protein
MTVNNDGKIKISFSEKLIVPSNSSVAINSSVLNVTLISKSEDEIKSK